MLLSSGRMVVYLNEKLINPSIGCDVFEFQPYLSTYTDHPLDNFKNNLNQSIVIQSEGTDIVKVPGPEQGTVLKKASLNDVAIGFIQGKINHTPVADFEAEIINGDLFLTNTSYDQDGDELDFHWKISDDILFTSKNVRYQFQNTGVHNITLTASDEELSNSKSISIVADGAQGYAECVLVDFSVAQTGNTFVITDTSEGRNTFGYDRKWTLDGTDLETTEDTLTLVLSDKQRHTLTLTCSAGRFQDSVDKYLYADVSAIISVSSVIIDKGTSIELDGTNSFAIEDQVNSYEWDEV